MSKFDAETIAAMKDVLQEVCSHIPAKSTAARTFVAAKILECASNGKRSHDSCWTRGAGLSSTNSETLTRCEACSAEWAGRL